MDTYKDVISNLKKSPDVILQHAEHRFEIIL